MKHDIAISILLFTCTFVHTARNFQCLKHDNGKFVGWFFFVSLGFIVSLENFSLIWRRHLHRFHLRGLVTLTPTTERLAVELSLPFLRLRSVASGMRTPNLPLAIIRWSLEALLVSGPGVAQNNILDIFLYAKRLIRYFNSSTTPSPLPTKKPHKKP